MTLFWTKTWDALAGVLFPTSCVSCGGLIEAHDPPLCPNCWSLVPQVEVARCDCGTPLPGAAGEACGRCRRGRSVIARGASLGSYSGTLRDCIQAFKYQGRHKTARSLGSRLLRNRRCLDVLDGADVLLGVPLHPDRLRERGFNQSDLLVEALARECLSRTSRDLVRIRRTRSQTDLSARERRLNVRKAFAVRSGSSLRGATVVLVDDVTTTGATIRECALALLDHGAREVRAITVARAE